MTSLKNSIVFLDNAINQIYKTIDLLKTTNNSVIYFTQEKELLDFLKEKNPEIIFLHLDLFPNDAVTVFKEIKAYKTVPRPYIIIYSDKQDDFVQELALNSGVDSFIGFHNKPAVMAAYIGSLLKRRSKIKDNKTKALVIDHEKYLIYKSGRAIQLARKEYQMFELFFNNAGKFFTKQEIAESIWGDANISKTRTIDVHIYNIRQFFGKQVIQNQKGKGYRMNKKQIGS